MLINFNISLQILIYQFILIKKKKKKWLWERLRYFEGVEAKGRKLSIAVTDSQ